MTRVLTEEQKERYRRSSREAKRRRTGTCVDCGGTTRYNGRLKGMGASRRCANCNARRVARRRRGTGSSQVRILELLAHGPATFTQIGQEVGGQPSSYINRLVRYGLIVRVRRGVYDLPDRRSPT